MLVNLADIAAIPIRQVAETECFQHLREAVMRRALAASSDAATRGIIRRAISPDVKHLTLDGERVSVSSRHISEALEGEVNDAELGPVLKRNGHAPLCASHEAIWLAALGEELAKSVRRV